MILANTDQIARIVDSLFAAARAEAGPRGVAEASRRRARGSRVVRASSRPNATSTSRSTVPSTLRIGVDRDLAERILHPVLDNACRYGAHTFGSRSARDNGSVAFTVADDGPGVTEDELESIFEPTARGTAGRDAGPSAGLGLALARRLARSVSGDVEAEISADGGRFIVRLPSA